MTKPLFKKDPDNLTLFSNNTVSLTDAKIEELLANEIPALTYAAGHQGVKKFKNNFELLQEFVFGQGGVWPRIDKDWRHSDFVRVGYPYLFRLFDDWKQKTDGVQ
jgi:hypothetical protein